MKINSDPIPIKNILKEIKNKEKKRLQAKKLQDQINKNKKI